MSDLHDNQRAAFDDDRLLDFALGLEDDPQLAAALSQSARLRERLADLKSDLATIDRELRSYIPPVDETWAEPGARWPRLRAAFGLRPAARAGGRRGRRLATVLIAAALLVAVVIGTVVVLPRRGSSGASSAGSEKSAFAPAAQSNGAAAGATPPAVVASRAAAYAVVAVVRVGPLRGASQSYVVVRRLKGRAPAQFTLVLQAIGGAPQAGSLAIAYLDPIGAFRSVPTDSTATTAPAPATPAPFMLAGRPALVTALPAGASAAAVRLP